MKNTECSKNHGLFNLLILSIFGIFIILIKVIKQDSNTKDVVFKEFKEEGGVKKITPQKFVKKSIQKPKVEKVKIEGLNERQEVILMKLKEEGSITPKELNKLIPDVSSRTIRRDMDNLCAKGFAKQEGSTKSTIYKYIG